MINFKFQIINIFNSSLNFIISGQCLRTRRAVIAELVEGLTGTLLHDTMMAAKRARTWLRR